MYNIPSDKRELDILKHKIADRYVEKYCLKRIPRTFRIISNQKPKPVLLQSEVIGVGKGQLRLTNYSPDFVASREQILNVQAELEETHSQIGDFPKLEWMNEDKQNWERNISYVYGKPYVKVRNTKFCHPRTFHYFESLSRARELIAEKNQSVFYVLLAESQNSLLKRFLENAPTIVENENFVFERIPMLSRFSVATVWAVSLLFSKVCISRCKS